MFSSLSLNVDDRAALLTQRSNDETDKCNNNKSVMFFSFIIESVIMEIKLCKCKLILYKKVTSL